MALHTLLFSLAVSVPSAVAYPWVAGAAGVDSSLLGRHVPLRRDDPNCPVNPNHVPAPLVTDQFPYNNAKNGAPGNGKGGYPVPAPGDTVHQFQAPNPKTDIRGPCPGLNTMANHGFLARDGIVTYNELVDAQQNVFNVGYDLANLLAIAGVGLDGDIVGTTKLSLGCDATSRTATPGNILAEELGLNGHNHFEADASLTRNDYFTGNGDDYSWNATLFSEMLQYCKGNCGMQELSQYRLFRWGQSRAENPNFFFGPGSLLLYGAATFLYELFPGEGGVADEATMMSFFGASKNASGYYWNGGERIPPNWTARVDPYTNSKIGDQIFRMYLLNPVLFGGNVGSNNFLGLNYSSYINNGELKDYPYNAMCLIYQTLTEGFPAEFGQLLNIPVQIQNFITGRIAPMSKNLGCPQNQNSGSPSKS